MTETRVDPSNADQLREWNGDQGEYWARYADRVNAAIAEYHGKFLDAAAIEPAASVLDVGCGSGQTSLDAARRAGEGTVLGVDLSAPMLELARRLAAREGLDNVTFEQADAQIHPFPDNHFDVAISRNGAMFFGDAPAAFANIARALRPGGRLVLLAWQPLARNEWLSSFRAAVAVGRELPVPQEDGPSPFSLSDPDRVRRLLTGAGFDDVRQTSLTEQMYFGANPDDACEHISTQMAWMVADLDDTAKATALANLHADMTSHHTDRGVRYDSASWLIEASALS